MEIEFEGRFGKLADIKVGTIFVTRTINSRSREFLYRPERRCASSDAGKQNQPELTTAGVLAKG
jgi:hypothetical protein